MENILVIGIAGGTGSGKTTLVKRIKEQFGDVVSVLSHDNYYRRLDHMPLEERCKVNYDEPKALETELMSLHLEQLRRGEAIDCPVYDFPSIIAPTRSSALSPRRSSSWRAFLFLKTSPCGI